MTEPTTFSWITDRKPTDKDGYMMPGGSLVDSWIQVLKKEGYVTCSTVRCYNRHCAELPWAHCPDWESQAGPPQVATFNAHEGDTVPHPNSLNSVLRKIDARLRKLEEKIND